MTPFRETSQNSKFMKGLILASKVGKSIIGKSRTIVIMHWFKSLEDEVATLQKS